MENTTKTHTLIETEKDGPEKMNSVAAFALLQNSIYAALETYSNVHRGSGHNSLVTTHLYEQARDIVLEHLSLDKNRFTVIFCTPRNAVSLSKQLSPGTYQILSDADTGISLGVRAMAIQKKALPKGAPLQTGGGTTKLISKDWAIWADGPDKFEAGTPAIINCIAFAKALLIIKQSGKDIFLNIPAEKLTATDILYHDDLSQFNGQQLLDELRKTMIGRDILVPTVEGNKPFINFDNSASTPTFTPVWNAFRQALQQPQQIKHDLIQEVKAICGGVLNAPPENYDIVFTSNTTEAINLVAESLGRETNSGSEQIILNSIAEHSSNELPWRMIPGVSMIRLSVNGEGFLDMSELETTLKAYNQEGSQGNKQISLVAVSGASNVLGICNDLAEISRITHKYGARLLVDAAQLIAHRQVDMEGCSIDYLAFSAHKVYAPFGSGVLAVRKGLLAFNAAELELIRSSGEENVGGIAALGKALLLLQRIGMDVVKADEQFLTAKLLRGLAKIPGLRVYGLKDPESPGFPHKLGVIVFAPKNKMPSRVAKQLALQGGIGVRYGCHCAHIIIKHLLGIRPFMEGFQRLIQILYPKLKLLGLVRVSIGIENSSEDVDKLIQVMQQIVSPAKELSGKGAISGKPVYTLAETEKQTSDFVRASAEKVYPVL
jgi:selenocysteine lyase/cysteine desulfurase